MAASKDRTWTCGDPWQYITCLPGLSGVHDPFDMTEEVVRVQQEPVANPSPDPTHPTATAPQPASLGKEKKMVDSSGKGGAKRAGACRLYNKVPGECPYEKDCIFAHYCSNCGAVSEHNRMACLFPPRFPRGPSTH